MTRAHTHPPQRAEIGGRADQDERGQVSNFGPQRHLEPLLFTTHGQPKYATHHIERHANLHEQHAQSAPRLKNPPHQEDIEQARIDAGTCRWTAPVRHAQETDECRVENFR